MDHPAFATTDRVAELQSGWPAFVRLTPTEFPQTSDGTLPLDGPNIYGFHPYLFAGAFSAVDPAHLAQLSVSAWLFASAIFAVDHSLDDDQTESTGSPLDLMANQFEGYRSLARLFPGYSPFWDVLQARLADYAEVAGEQHAYVTGRRPLADFPYEKAEHWATAKSALATVTVAALGELAAEPGPVAELTRSVRAYSVALQFLDDIRDWRQDLSGMRPSYPLAEALSAAGFATARQGPGTPEEVERVGRALYFGGAAARIMKLAGEQVALAMEAARGLGVDDWLHHLEQVAAAVRGMAAQLPDDAAARKRGQAASGLSVRMRVDRSRAWQPLAGLSLRWLLGQWRLGFPDATHVMVFPGMAEPGPHLGDVFSRAVIANVLADADRVLAGGQLAPVLAAEADHLLSRRRADEPGLWSYFPELPDLACDADDLAEALRLLVRVGRIGGQDGQDAQPADRLGQALESALDLALVGCARPDGSFDTWLIPPDEQAPWAQRQRAAAAQLWGEGADAEVVANLLDAVSDYRPERYQDALGRGADYLLGLQDAEGWWSSGWYHGRLYGTYRCLRAIRRVRPDATGVARRAQDYLLAIQSADGSWSNASGESDVLGTSLALLALAEAHRMDAGLAAACAEARTEARTEAVLRARDYLRDQAGPDGSYASEPFIMMSPQRAPGMKQPLAFGGRSLTTALVCQAALAWEELS
ncbi:squalene-hopene/tetraprenyl-beta-curcumene cyclase [Streptacidiphilus sp. MAP12-16]|uniref:prenyltransferase/squalene oxidase repeat-containing protein n=1 Tax=Streptacidiphilus sp. MAP12-16 TaxID=3156300 RepID=UPI0035143683